MKFKVFMSTILLMLSGYSEFQPAAAAQDAAAPSEIRVPVGKSVIVNSAEMLQRVSVTNSDIASAVIVTPTQVLIHGQAPGSVTLVLWDQQDRPRTFNLTVELDIEGLRETIDRVLPENNIEVAQSGQSLVLSGNVPSQDVVEKAAALATAFSPTVVNLLTATPSRQVILLQVKFAEVDRAAIQQLGMNLFSTGGANTIGSISTQQFEQFAGNVGAIPPVINRGSDPRTPNLASGGIGRDLPNTPAVFGLNDLLNVFLFRPDLNLGVTIKALQQQNLLQILAEPNVMAINGSEASFLAGGEFPFPVVQAGSLGNSISIEFKEFGIRLNFTPQVQSDGAIRLKVRPEVSALDFSNALTVSGFLIPALSTRRAETEVELRDGQSFAIAGLMDNRMTEIGSKVPVLGDLPIIGHMFRSRAQNKTTTELLVTVTPHLVQGVSPDQLPALPEFPKPFLDPGSFDGNTGEAPAQSGSLLPTPPPAEAVSGVNLEPAR